MTNFENQYIHKFEIVNEERDGIGEIREYHLLCECGEMRKKQVNELKEE